MQNAFVIIELIVGSPSYGKVLRHPECLDHWQSRADELYIHGVFH